MRDGIPKTLPVPRKWQAFVECADRSADRGTNRVVTRLSDAIQFCLGKLFPRDGRESLIKLTSEMQPSLPGLQLEGIAARPVIGLGQDHNVPELIIDARALVQKGETVSAALRDALAKLKDTPLLARTAERQIANFARDFHLDPREISQKMDRLIDVHGRELRSFVKSRPANSIIRELGEALL